MAEYTFDVQKLYLEMLLADDQTAEAFDRGLFDIVQVQQTSAGSVFRNRCGGRPLRHCRRGRQQPHIPRSRPPPRRPAAGMRRRRRRNGFLLDLELTARSY